ncbi:MAG: exodeoxyribonuclease VII large subunit [Bacteroidales bacterium]|nr:exodeoxyribonuclease VII large subunit [Bacteroidales bacterium]
MAAVEEISLLELQTLIAEGIEDAVPGKLWIRAEIASVQAKSNGHCYLELCQNEGGRLVAKARAVIWKNVFFALRRYFYDATGSDLTPGMQILARVQVSYSELYGLSLVIDELEPRFTLGAAELEKRRTIEKLEKEGLLDRQQELSLADLPYSLAVISAEDAAGFGDFCRHLSENEYGFKFRVELFPAVMQGESAPESIIDALQAVEAEGGFDAVLILRGGGARLDLACFDDYGLAFAIANCGIPVFTAIGHERDHSVADMVAFRAVKTPTALADEFIDAFAAEDERISSFSNRLRLALSGKISAMENAVSLLQQRIRAADPRNILTRGYSLVTDEGGVVLKSASGLKAGRRLRILFADGSVDAEVL